jgi:DNA replication protein DnaC
LRAVLGRQREIWSAMKASTCSRLIKGLGEPTVADAILDRLLHGAHRLELRGESRRRSDPASLPIAEAASEGR